MSNPRAGGLDTQVALKRLSDLREWLRNGNAYMEHPDGQEGTDNAVDALDFIIDELRTLRTALRPFAALLHKSLDSRVGGDAAPVFSIADAGEFTVGDVRRAAMLVGAPERDPNEAGGTPQAVRPPLRPICERCTRLMLEAEPTEEAVEYYELTGHFAGCARRPIPLEQLIRQIIDRVADLPDRTSPDDQPDMMLVTSDELAAIIEAVWEEAGQ